MNKVWIYSPINTPVNHDSLTIVIIWIKFENILDSNGYILYEYFKELYE